MKDLSDFDLDEQALVKKKRPWGWFAAGLTLLLAVTFALGFALPLSSSHEKLTAEHEKLAEKAAELDKAFTTTKKKLDETEQARRGLETRVTTLEEAQKAVASRVQMSGASTERALESLVKAKLVRVTSAEEDVTVTVQNRALFLPRSAKTNPSMGKMLCKMLDGVSQEKDWRIVTKIGFPQAEKDAWKDAGEKAAALGSLLQERCKPPEGRLLVGIQGVSEGESSDQTVFTFGPVEHPKLPGDG